MSKKKNKNKTVLKLPGEEKSIKLNKKELDSESLEGLQNKEIDKVEDIENNIEDFIKDDIEMESRSGDIDVTLKKFESGGLPCTSMKEELDKMKKMIEKEDILKQKEKELDSKEKELYKLDKSLKKAKEDIERDRTKLQLEEKRIKNANKDLDKRKENAEENLNLYIEDKRIDKIDKLEKEIQAKRNKVLIDLQKTITEERSAQRKELDKLREDNSKRISDETLEFEKRRHKILEEIQREKEEALKKIEEERKIKYKELQDKEANIEQIKENIIKREDIVNQRITELKYKEKELSLLKDSLERKQNHIDEEKEDLDKAIVKRKDELIINLKEEIQRKNESIEILREELNEERNDKENFNNFINTYGDPTVIQRNIAILKGEVSMLREQIVNMVYKDKYDELDSQYRELQKAYDNIKQSLDDTLSMNDRDLEYEIKFHTEEMLRKSRENTIVALKQELENKEVEIIRLTAPIGRGGDRDKRIEAINSGALDDNIDLIGSDEDSLNYLDSMTEIEWLDGIADRCEQYGISFNKRLLYAFHTALKINEWSIITVLAGVSGTGKSELPKLYAAFGGLNFCSAAVQPNWDSQESMLGFFNSIDNKFEPEQILKFLAQCTDNSSEYSKFMSIVLLDEMNLAHVEHYFANFLSKLEYRRGVSKAALPSIDVKLGAGVEPYKLKLTRGILWTGTMNQDETTKSLSDKVLDRGIIINFPRPKELIRRKKMNIISRMIKEAPRPKLTIDKWMGWTSYEIVFSDEQMEQMKIYKKMVEEINDSLELVGRALGHRVWQSIEFYVMNYPKVMAAMNYENKGELVKELTPEIKTAMKIAFEDQIVQKVMPKLRGIETKDKVGKKCLDKIKDILNKYEFESLQGDFDFAREIGYGQFMWNSAKYLDKSEEFFQNNLENELTENIVSANNMEIEKELLSQ